MGMTPHVVGFAPRLMPLQVDEGGGALLARLVTDLGLTVHTGVGTSSITENTDGAGLSVELSDGSVIDAALVVFSAGVRPQDRLARDCGLEMGARGGILVDIGCRTVDPDVYAIGECAAVEGTCEDSLGIGAELEADMDRHVAGYKDEWAGVLEDEEKLGRFVSFVNVPEVIDPTIAFDESGERKVPVLMGMPVFGRMCTPE